MWATRQLCTFWLIGIVIFMCNSGSMAAVYFGRFFAGIGIGETVVVAPVYLSEIAPAQIRGLCTCAFTGAVYLGILIAYFANYGAQIHMGSDYPNPARWVSYMIHASCWHLHCLSGIKLIVHPSSFLRLSTSCFV